MLNVPQTPKEAKKILKETGISNAQKVVKKILKRSGVKETSGESKAVVLEDVLDARKISEKVPVMLDARRTLETLEVLKRASGNVYREWEKAKFDINHWFTVNCFNERFPYTLFYLATDFELKNVSIALLEVKESDINTESPFSKWSALHWATEKGNIRVVLELTKRGANVNQLDSSERTTLYQPAANGDIEVTEILVKNKADVNAEDLARLTALYEAARNGHKEVVKFLMNSGADVKKNGALKLTPLHIAVANVDEAMVDCIIKNDKNIGKNIEAVDVLGWTPLYWAAAKNNTVILEILLQAISKYGANVNIEDNLIGRSPLHIAVTNGNMEAVELLTRYGASINQMDTWGYAPFDCAIRRGNREVMDFLIEHGANIERKDPHKMLLFTNTCNYLEAAGTIVQLEIQEDMTKLIGTEFLRHAAGRGDIPKVRALLEYGVNVNASADLKLTALHHAAINGHKNVIETLNIYKAGMNPQDTLGLTPLHYATMNCHEEAIKTLISCGASIWIQNKCGEKAIDCAKSSHIKSILKRAEKKEKAQARAYDVTIESEESDTALDTIEGEVANTLARVQLKSNEIGHLANTLARVQLKSNEIGHLANTLTHTQLESSAEACPAEMDGGIKEQRAHSPCRWTYRKRKLSTEMDSDSSTETDECNDRWSYGR
ncbi:ankyrin repeat domain-containing protein [Wolbachia endosymbiont of Cylisticus convexus]|uniref:ankyrin repeat domain-containing protein n=1 Tax=Wolbachia endosymbiont of Cylisticus convexus TaxID=118728 RepID=UPI001F48BAB4|nr:ankyrin repeat domain-containing protein [Wolbachia endosymbiont of Cylisticus convexus]